jgi:hypothetical protein
MKFISECFASRRALEKQCLCGLAWLPHLLFDSNCCLARSQDRTEIAALINLFE